MSREPHFFLDCSKGQNPYVQNMPKWANLLHIDESTIGSGGFSLFFSFLPRGVDQKPKDAQSEED